MQKSQTNISFYEKNYVERQINLTSPIYTVWQNSPIYEKNKNIMTQNCFWQFVQKLILAIWLFTVYSLLDDKQANSSG